MRGKEFIEKAAEQVKSGDHATSVIVECTHTQLLELHARALACHCECLAMNAANCARACENLPMVYPDSDYYHVMRKWGLINEKGEPTI